METGHETEDLLERLAALAGCEYLSDLGRPQRRAALLRAVRQTPPEDFSSQEWREARSYLLSEPVGEGTAQSHRQALLDALA